MPRKHILSLLVCLAVAALVAGAAPALAADGGDGQNAAPVHLKGSDSVEATQEVIDAFAVGATARKYQLLERLYSKDVVYDDLAFNIHEGFGPWVLWKLRRDLRQVDDIRVVAAHADHGWGVIEQKWDFSSVHGIWIQAITLLQISSGRIAYEAWYYQDPLALPSGGPPEPTPLATPPGLADTAGAAEAVALKYALALQARDAAAMAALSAPKIAFLDTAAGSVAGSPGQVRAHYAGIFEQPADLVFENLRYVCGAGWAAVIWTASAQSSESSGEGATMLEIRGGKIARETLYYTLANVPFVV
jgi:ketosteroid isomerase-like protein